MMGLRQLFSRKSSKLILVFFAVLVFLVSASSVLGANCWDYNGNQAACVNISDSMNCRWLSYGQQWCTNGSGCCDMLSCGLYDGNRSGCLAAPSGLGCSWVDNSQNNQVCQISSSNPYRSDGSLATGEDLGCCRNQQCFNRDGTSEASCENSSFMNGFCNWVTQAQDSSCPNALGCCRLPICRDATTLANCTFLVERGQPCSWNSGSLTCQDTGFGGFNGANSCVQNGGYWNGTGCQMPTYGDMAIVRCWFADFNEALCRNITGCKYCNNAAVQVGGSLCGNGTVGWCRGHEPTPGNDGLPTTPITCNDINLSTACDCGPIPGCYWTNSSVVFGGAYCSVGVSSCNLNFQNLTYNTCKDAPNEGNCTSLRNNYFMPCRFNLSGDGRCEFDWQSGGGYGDSKGGTDFAFEDIMSENTCTFAGGIWKTVTTDAYGNTQGWCEFGFGAGTETCNSSCWACELQDNGQPWGSLAAARGACNSSIAGGGTCNFISFGGSADPSGKYGWCDFPTTMNYIGGGNCGSSCYDCFGQTMCQNSAASCTWVSDPMGFGPGWCDPSSVAQANNCTTSALACTGQTQCLNAGHNWTNAYVNEYYTNQPMWVCIPNGTTRNANNVEICFVIGDEDGDGAQDCADSNCSTDKMCGYGMGMGGGAGGGTGVGGGGGGMMLPQGMDETVCFAYDNTNATLCEARIVTQNLAFNGTHRGNNTYQMLPSFMNNTQLCYYHAAPPGSGESGLCDPLFNQQMKGGMDMGKPPTPIGVDASGDANGINYLDIIQVGIMDIPQTMGVGIPLKNITNFAACYNKLGGTSNGTIYRYIDSDNNASSGCTATNGTYDGFDYKLVVIATYDGTNANTVTLAYRCINFSNNLWSQKSASLALMDEACYASPPQSAPEFGSFSGVNILTFTKSDFGIATSDLRILVATAGPGYNETNVTDQAGPFYYTPGAIDFKMEDCFGFVDVDGDGLKPDKDPDCKFIKNLGFIPFEDCKDGVDNNADGVTDCNDPMCAYTPVCGGGFSFIVSGTDTTAPNVVFYKADTFNDGAFIKYDTNEPANGTVYFYRNDSGCTQVNKTIYDTGNPFCSGAWCSYDDFKLWHEAFIDNSAGNYYRLGYNLVNGTTYFYKYKVCDPSGNCAVSGCSNFTTKASIKNFFFGMSAPSGFTVKTPWAQGGQNYSTQVNSSLTKDINITVECSTQGYSIRLVGVDIKSAEDVDFTGFLCDASNKLIGMNSSNWNKILFGLSVDYVEITWVISGTSPVVYNCDTNGSNCVNVNTYLSCTSTATSITCRIPATLGFSAYKVTTTPSSDGTTGGGGGGGGGGGAVAGAKVSKKWNYLAPGASATMEIKKAELALTELSFTVIKNASNVEVSVEKLFVKPSAISQNVTGEVYKYLKIEKTNLNDSNIKSAEAKFEVEKSWLSNYSIDDNKVYIYRFVNDWEQQDTSKVSANKTHVKYKSTLSGLSYFAIAGTKTCIESWECTQWSECKQSNYMERTCTDKNTCGTTLQKPDERKDCAYTPTAMAVEEEKTRVTQIIGGISLPIGKIAVFVIVLIAVIVIADIILREVIRKRKMAKR